MDRTGRLAAAGAAAFAIGEALTPDPSYGQLPFYSGTVGKPYAVEGRQFYSPEEGASGKYIGKFCPQIGGLKLWSYAGVASEKNNAFWGIGTRFPHYIDGNVKVSSILSLDGNEDRLDGFSVYNTLEYGNMFVDLSPGFHKDADGNLTPDFHANVGRNFSVGKLGNMSLGLTSGMDNQYRARDTYVRAVLSKSAGNFVDLGIGYRFQEKAPVVRISVQRSFGDHRSKRGGRG
jgi:hypothetical protein